MLKDQQENIKKCQSYYHENSSISEKIINDITSIELSHTLEILFSATSV